MKNKKIIKLIKLLCSKLRIERRRKNIIRQMLAWFLLSISLTASPQLRDTESKNEKNEGIFEENFLT